MNNYEITSCSTTDLPIEFYNNENLKFLSFHYFVNGKSNVDDLYQSINAKEFFDIASKENVTTSQVSPEEYIDVWEKILQDGKDIIHISLSSAISGTYNSSCIARDTLTPKYKDRKITVIDSLSASSGYGLLLYIANEKKKEGYDYNKLVDFIEKEKMQIQHLFYSTDLTNFVKGGRISKTEGLIGSMLSICPYMSVSKEGKLAVLGKARGTKKARQEIIECMKKNIKNGVDYDGLIFINHSDTLDELNAMIDLIKENFPKSKFIEYSVCMIGPTIGTHTGRGTVALYYECDERL
ncbi:MAG: DegV family protein [Eubacteriales bacterium]|nr:DegV family protein [Eubacteriales bacterium]